MSQAEITAFNNKFLKYEGSNKSLSEVKSMCNEVLASNADSSNIDRRICVLGKNEDRIPYRQRRNNNSEYITLII